jgi:hypothetical protein
MMGAVERQGSITQTPEAPNFSTIRSQSYYCTYSSPLAE